MFLNIEAHCVLFILCIAQLSNTVDMPQKFACLMIPNFYRTLASMVTSSKTLRCTDLVHSKVTGYTPNSMQSLIPREFATGECNRTSRIHCNSTKKLYRKEQGKNPKQLTSNRFRKLKGTPVVPKLKQMEKLRVNPILIPFRQITLNHDSSVRQGNLD